MASCRNSLLLKSLAPAVPSHRRPAPVGSVGRQGSIPCPQGQAGPGCGCADHGSTVAIGPIVAVGGYSGAMRQACEGWVMWAGNVHGDLRSVFQTRSIVVLLMNEMRRKVYHYIF